MKNQNDLIFSIVFGVLGLIAFGIAIATKPEPPSIPAPPTINVAEAPLPATAVAYGTALPNAGSGATGAPGGFGGGGGGGSFGPPSAAGGMSVGGSSSSAMGTGGGRNGGPPGAMGR